MRITKRYKIVSEEQVYELLDKRPIIDSNIEYCENGIIKVFLRLGPENNQDK